MDMITTGLWKEVPSEETPFRPKQCLCAGFDVYEDLAGNASFTEYLYLLFKQEPPSRSQVQLLNTLAICIANLGPRDHGVQSAMTASAGGAGAAASLIAAISASAGQFGGGREVATVSQNIDSIGTNTRAWIGYLQESARSADTPHNEQDVWPTEQHPPGFDPYTSTATEPIQQAIRKLAQISDGDWLPWLEKNYQLLEVSANAGLAMSFVAAAALADLGMDTEESEMLYLFLRLPGAAAHALEQRWRGWQDFPFYQNGIDLSD